MAFTNSNDYLRGRLAAPHPAGGEVIACRFAIDLVTADLDANDVGAVGILPAGCVPVALIVDADDLDTNATPTNTMSVGLVNAGETDLETTWASGLQQARTGTAGQVDLSTAAQRMAATQANRKFGIKFTAASATKAAGTVGLTLLYRAV